MAKKRRRRRVKKTAKLTATEVSSQAQPSTDCVEVGDGAPVRAEGSGRGSERILTLSVERTIVAALLVLCAISMVTASVRNSAVADELGAHIPAGYLYWISGDFSGGIDNFPLGQLWIGLPVKMLGLEYELFTEQHLQLFRFPVMVLGLVLAFGVYRFARRHYGQQAGLVALFMATLSPNFLAHATLATLDLPTAFVVFFVVAGFYHYWKCPSSGRLTFAALALAVALVVKIQTVLLVPFAGLVLVLAALRLAKSGKGSMAVMLTSWMLLPLAFLAVVHLVYLEFPSPANWLMPEAYVEAIAGKLTHGRVGHFGYLLGHYSAAGWWSYFPIAILLKTPLPLLVLVVLGLVRRPRLDTVVFVLLPIALFLGAGVVGRVNIGLRHVLAIYPFLYVLAGAGASRIMAAGWKRLVLGGLLVLYGAQALWIQPHHLSYFNLLAGGPGNGDRFLLDSNYDWGQNDRYLERHVARTGLDYKIDPDPFSPTTGPVLVNANALHGLLNGGPTAYAWLREYEPDDRVAYTWFEYRLPEGPEANRVAQSQRLDRLGGHLLWLRRDPVLADARLRLSLARTLAVVTLYGPAFDEIRTLLDDRPDDKSALGLGGELIVRHKLGVLRYRGDEYLTGFREPPAAIELPPHEVVEFAASAGVGEQVSTFFTLLGSSWFGEQRVQDAMVATRMAVALDPSNDVARDNLRQIEMIMRRMDDDRRAPPEDRTGGVQR